MVDAEQNDRIAARAYQLWVHGGCPAGRELEFWLEAEDEERRSQTATVWTDDERWPISPETEGSPLAPAEGWSGYHEAGAEKEPESPPVSLPAERFIAVLDRAHLRIYQVNNGDETRRTRFELADSYDLPDALQHVTDAGADEAGRFEGRAASIAESLPIKNEQKIRLAEEFAEHLRHFLEAHDHATWDYAAGPALHGAVLDRLPPAVRSRLDRALPQELASPSEAELEAHFTP
jgi:hypothetical protein